MGFNNYDEQPPAQEPVELTIDVLKQITDMFANNRNVAEIRYVLRLKRSLVIKAIEFNKRVEKAVIKIMRGRAVETEAVYNEDGIIIEPTKFYSIPTTKIKLGEILLPMFPEPRSEYVTYIANKVIEVGTSAGTWLAFKAIFTQ